MWEGGIRTPYLIEVVGIQELMSLPGVQQATLYWSLGYVMASKFSKHRILSTSLLNHPKGVSQMFFLTCEQEYP